MQSAQPQIEVPFALRHKSISGPFWPLFLHRKVTSGTKEMWSFFTMYAQSLPLGKIAQKGCFDNLNINEYSMKVKGLVDSLGSIDHLLVMRTWCP